MLKTISRFGSSTGLFAVLRFAETSPSSEAEKSWLESSCISKSGEEALALEGCDQ